MQKTILITGSTDGIGRKTALELAQMGHRVIIHGRNRSRLDATARHIDRVAGGQLAMQCLADFSSLTQVEAMAGEINRNTDKLDVLINNAGILHKSFELSHDGYELTFAVNHLAPFLLTNLLLPLLKASAPARIVNVSSMIHSSRIDFDNLQGEKAYEPINAYSLSKLCNVLFTYKLAENLKNEAITVNCLHPGVINTKIFRSGWGGGGAPLGTGSANLIHAATDPRLDSISGVYFQNQKIASTAQISHDRVTQQRLWDISQKLVNRPRA